MRFSLTTWNINSVRLRIDIVARFLKSARPDVLCLQETKCIDDAFPLKRFSGKASSMHLVSCRHKTSGRIDLMNFATRSMRSRTELMFQVVRERRMGTGIQKDVRR